MGRRQPGLDPVLWSPSRCGWRIPGCPGASPHTLLSTVPASSTSFARGRTLRSLAKEFGVTDTSIRNWLRQADLDQGRRTDGLTSDEKKELTQLRRENVRLREERDILNKAATWTWFAREAAYTPKKRTDS